MNRTLLISITATLVVVGSLTTLVVLQSRHPSIQEVSPDPVQPGITVTLQGSAFGDEPGSVRVGSEELTRSQILSWSDDRLQFRWPDDRGAGMVRVHNGRRESDAILVVSQDAMPLRQPSESERMRIFSVTPESPAVGETLEIAGRNFGGARRSARVLFPGQFGEDVAVSTQEDGYIFWSDELIRVRVPEFAADGRILIETNHAQIQGPELLIDRSAGTIEHGETARYLVRYGMERIGATGATEAGEADTEPVAGGTQAASDAPVVWVLPRLARPVMGLESATVRLEGVTEEMIRAARSSVSFPQPERTGVSRVVLVESVSVRSEVNPSGMVSYDLDSGLFRDHVREHPLFPTSDSLVGDIVVAIQRGRQDPWSRSRASYDYTRRRLVPAETVEGESGERDIRELSVREMIEQQAADSLGYALVFTTLNRRANVPTRMVSGLAYLTDGTSQPHYWAEVFIPGLGWVPVDPGAADGVLGRDFTTATVPEETDPVEHFFGNLDNRRVTISRTGLTLTEHLYPGGYSYDAVEALWFGLPSVEAPRPEEPVTNLAHHARILAAWQ